MNKKTLILALLAIVVILSGCVKEKVVLNELQTAACDAAHDNNNCGKLEGVGLVTESDCCLALEKCCPLVSTTGHATLYTTLLSTNSPIDSWVTADIRLSDIQIAACQSAHNNNNCDLLVDLGVVSEEECCSELGVCCSDTVVSVSDLKDALIIAIKDYFANPQGPILTLSELKDLIMAYFSASGDTVDLSGIGYYSGEKLIDIYNKVKVVIPPTCTDSDGGRDYYTKGIVYEGESYYHDKCVTPAENQDATNYYIEYGGVYYVYNDWEHDSCSGSNCYVAEAYCDYNGQHNFEVYQCPNGCQDGACVQEGKVRGYIIQGTNQIVPVDYVFGSDPSSPCNIAGPAEICPADVIASSYDAIGDCTIGDTGYAIFSIAYCSDAIKEEVECVFYNTYSEQTCSSNLGHTCTAYPVKCQVGEKCEGRQSCKIVVAGKKGEQLTWKSPCEMGQGYYTTVIDGNDEALTFDCAIKECYDSDGGINYYVRGETRGYYQGNLETVQDTCLKSPTEITVVDTSHYLGELYCEDDTNMNYEVYECPDLCVDGACIEETRCVSGTSRCDEKGYYVQKCDDSTGQWYNAQYCPNGCSDGACLEIRCIPYYSTRCDEKGYYVQKCNYRGQWYNVEYCPDGCDNGQCKLGQTHCNRCSTWLLYARVDFYTTDPACYSVIPSTNPVTKTCDCSCTGVSIGGIQYTSYDTTWSPDCIKSCNHCNRCSNVYAYQRTDFYTDDLTCKDPKNNPVTRTCDCSCPAKGLDTTWNPACIKSCKPATCPTYSIPYCPDDGKIVSGGVDENGCAGPGQCVCRTTGKPCAYINGRCCY